MPPVSENQKSVINRRTALKGLAAGGVSGLVFGGNVVAKPGKGNTQGKCDIVVPDDYSMIQGAVDAASPGDTVCVKDGTYAEQVVINKSLSLQSAANASPTIEPEDSPDAYTIAESGPTWEPMVFAYGGSESDGDVSGSGTVEVNLSGFTLDGLGEQPDARRKPAVLYRNASGTVSEHTVENIGLAGSETFGILAYGDSDVTVEENEVRDFERGGIGANGDGGEHPSPNLVVRNNTLDSNSEVGVGWAPNGIQIGFGATGRVKDNTIRDCRWAGSAKSPWQASGILIFESDGVKIHRNTLMNNDVAAAVSAWGYFRGTASNCKLTGNKITDSLIGVNLRATAWDQDSPPLADFTNQDPHVNNNKVVNNEIENREPDSDPVGAVGIAVESNEQNESDAYEPEVDNNKLIRNSITGYDEQVSNEGTDTKIRAIEP